MNRNEISLAVDRRELTRWISEIGKLEGVTIFIKEDDVSEPDPERRHNLYSIDYSVVAEIIVNVVSVAGGIATIYGQLTEISRRVKEKREKRAYNDPMVKSPDVGDFVPLEVTLETQKASEFEKKAKIAKPD